MKTLPAGRLAVIVGSVIAVAALLFWGYFRMALTMQINADGASNALQAWEMWHGNPILKGWTVTDVPFYTTELPQFMLIELFTGLHEHVFRVATASTYTMIVLLAAWLARGDATGRLAWIRSGVAVAILLLPMPGAGYLVAFGGPNHLGTSVPLLVTWIALQRFPDKFWLIGLLLVWGQIGDPLVMYIGVVPLALVSLVRFVRTRQCQDARLFLAAAVSVAVARGVLWLIHNAGGLIAHSPPTDFASPSKWIDHISLLGEVTLVNFGAYLPDMEHPVDIAVAVIRITGVVLAVAGLGLALRTSDRINQVLATAILVNVGAFIASTLPTDLMSARQVAVVLPMGAVLGARLCVNSIKLQAATVAVLVAFSGVFVWHAAQPPRPEPKREIVAWLERRDLRHGIGSYWNSNDLSLMAQYRLVVAPVIAGEFIQSYLWESKAEWYDDRRYDARFIIIDTERAAFGTIEMAHRQFGQPKERKDFGQYAVLVYDTNLLAILPAECEGRIAPNMAACLRPGSELALPPAGQG